MTRLQQALNFIRAFVDANGERADQSTLVRTGRRFVEHCERVGDQESSRARTLKGLLLRAIKADRWELAAEICRELAAEHGKTARAPRQTIVQGPHV